MKTIEPLVKFRTFGIHLLDNPAGTFSFRGEVPQDLNKSFKTYSEGFHALASWIRNLSDIDLKRELTTNATNELFALIVDETYEPNI